MTWPFGNIPKGKARFILADPAWDFKSNSVANPGRNARRHYGTMSLQDIAALPVADLAAEDCALGLWITGPFFAIGAHISIMKAWGFKPSGIGWVWVKLDKNFKGESFTMDDVFWGGGFTTRKCVEYVVLGKRGRSVRKSASVHEAIFAPRREHSRKPDEIFSRVEEYADGPYVELFARESRKGWHTWGNEKNKFDKVAA